MIVATTDEGAPWARRLGMCAALAPVAATIGVLAAIRLAETRGELRALAALGAEPVRAVAGAIVGGALLALLGPVLVASHLADLTALFPRPAVARVWLVEADGAMREVTQGLRLAKDGTLTLLEGAETGSVGLPSGTWGATLIALVLGAVAAPLWAAVPISRRRRALLAVVALAASIGAFQSVAAGRTGPALLVVAPLLLLADVAVSLAARRRAGIPGGLRSKGL